MSTEARQDAETSRGLNVWIAGVVSGLIAGVVMGLLISIGTTLMPLIGALYGQESFWWGWVAHLFNSAFFGLVFAFVVSHPVIRPTPPQIGTYLAYGLIYGAFLEILTGGILFPLWLQAAAAPALSFPFFPILGTVEQVIPAVVLGIAHLVYGALLGPLYATTSGSYAVRRGQVIN